MNKYEEALEMNTKYIIYYGENYSKSNYMLNIEPLFKELVEKAKPKKPIDKSFLYECPHCGVSSTIFSQYKFNNCPQCGGKLDWSK